MQLIMQSITVTKIFIELCHRNQIKLIVSLTTFEKSALIWNLIWSEPYVPHLNSTQLNSQFIEQTRLSCEV